MAVCKVVFHSSITEEEFVQICDTFCGNATYVKFLDTYAYIRLDNRACADRVCEAMSAAGMHVAVVEDASPPRAGKKRVKPATPGPGKKRQVVREAIPWLPAAWVNDVIETGKKGYDKIETELETKHARGRKALAEKCAIIVARSSRQASDELQNVVEANWAGAFPKINDVQTARKLLLAMLDDSVALTDQEKLLLTEIKAKTGQTNWRTSLHLFYLDFSRALQDFLLKNAVDNAERWKKQDALNERLLAAVPGLELEQQNPALLEQQNPALPGA